MFLWLKSHKKLVNNVFLLVKCVHAKKKKKGTWDCCGLCHPINH